MKGYRVNNGKIYRSLTKEEHKQIAMMKLLGVFEDFEICEAYHICVNTIYWCIRKVYPKEE